MYPPCDIVDETQRGLRAWTGRGICRPRGLGRVGTRALLTRHRRAWRTVVQFVGWPLDDLERNEAFLRVWRENRT